MKIENSINKDLMLKLSKGTTSITIKCKNVNHYNRLIIRFKKQGYKQVPYIEEVKQESYPF